MKKNYFSLLAAIFLLSIRCLHAQQGKENISKFIDADSSRLISVFKDLHANPELGFMEVRTSKIVADELQQLGYQVFTGIGKTGVVGVLKNGDGPTVMYRADMDANAVKETTGVPYSSNKTVKKDDNTTVPVMHACGHDAHITWLLGVARYMITNKDQWKGTLIMLAQPAEEPILGAEAMVNDGLYDKVPIPDYLFGLHTAPMPVGMVLAAKGERMAGTDQLDVTFHGIGGHGSSPHLAKDPIVMAAQAINAYQTVISRKADPQHATVLTVGAIHAGTDNNVIPNDALLKLNLRWYDEADRKLMLEAIKRINTGIAVAHDIPEDRYPTLIMKGWASPLINDSLTTEKVVRGLKQVLPENNIIQNFPRTMGSEDFQHLVIHNPKHAYSYINVGIANPAAFAAALAAGKQVPFYNHNGDYNVDPASIALGAKCGIAGLLALFENESN